MPLSFRTIIDASEDRIVVMRPDGTIEVCNRATERAYGGEVVGANVFELAPRDVVARLETMVALVVEGRRSVRFTQTISPERESDVVLSPIFDAAGEVERVLAVSRDVTVQRRLKAQLVARKEELQRSEERHRALFDQAAVGIVVGDLEGRVLEVNQRFVDLLGYTHEEITGLGIEGISHPDDMAEDLRLYSEMIEGLRERYSLEKRYFTKGGEVIWVEVSVTWRYSGEERIGLMGVITDITERKKAEQALRESEERLRVISETAPFPTVITRIDDGTLVWGNQALADFLRIPLAEVVGKRAPDYYVDRAQRDALIDRLRRDGRVDAMPVKMRAGDGSIMSTLASARPIVLGGVPMLMGASVDITELERAQEELRRRDALQRTLVREINHRVRNNLAAILGLLGLQRSRSEPSASSIIDDLEQRVRAFATVHDILSDWNWKPVPLTELCEKVVRTTTNAVCRHATSNEIAVRAEGLSISSHLAQQLALVLGELSTNACKHGHSSDGPLRIAIEARESGASLVLRFADRGPGFPDEIARAGSSEGSIGLRLVSGIVVRSLNGAIALDNTGGAVVTITVPYRHPETGKEG